MKKAGRTRGTFQAIAEDLGTASQGLHAERELFVITDFLSKAPHLRFAVPFKCPHDRPDIEMKGEKSVGIEIIEIFYAGNKHWSDSNWTSDKFYDAIIEAISNKSDLFDWGQRYDECWLLIHTSEHLLIPNIPDWLRNAPHFDHPFDSVFMTYIDHPDSGHVGAHRVGGQL